MNTQISPVKKNDWVEGPPGVFRPPDPDYGNCTHPYAQVVDIYGYEADPDNPPDYAWLVYQCIDCDWSTDEKGYTVYEKLDSAVARFIKEKEKEDGQSPGRI